MSLFSNQIQPLTVGLCVVGLCCMTGIYIAVFKFCQARKLRLQRESKRPKEIPLPDLAGLIAEIRPKALSYALYLGMLHRSLPVKTEIRIRDEYGNQLIPPRLYSCDVFNEYPSLLRSDALLEKMNEWIAVQGGEKQQRFFDASDELVRLVVSQCKQEAENILNREFETTRTA